MALMIKKSIRRLLGRFGYVVRHVGQKDGMTGVDLVHDVGILLGQKRPVVLFDVGANIGQTIASFLAMFPDSQIHSFEPSPATFEALRNAYGHDARIHLENLALGDHEGTLPFHVTNDYSVNDSLLEPAWDARATVVPVQASTLNRYCQQHRVESIDHLKIDTQGFDLQVLRGADQLLKEKRVRSLSVELTFSPMYKSQPPYIEVLSFLDAAGYQLLGFYEQTYRHNQLIYANALFRAGRVSDRENVKP
jgi:FkbM family methyltransferase